METVNVLASMANYPAQFSHGTGCSVGSLVCACTSPLSAVPPCAEIAAVAVAMFALAWLNKKNQKNQNQMKNQKMNNLAFL